MTNDIEHELEQMVLENWGLVFDLHNRAEALSQRIVDETRAGVDQREELESLGMEPWYEGKKYWTLHFPGPQGAGWHAWVNPNMQKDADKPTVVVRTGFNPKSISKTNLLPELEARLPASLARYRAGLSRSANNVIAEVTLTNTDVDELIDKIIEEAVSQIGLAALVVSIVQERQSSAT